MNGHIDKVKNEPKNPFDELRDVMMFELGVIRKAMDEYRKEDFTFRQEIKKEIKAIHENLDPMANAWKTTTAGGQLFKIVGKFIIQTGLVIGALILLGQFIKHKLLGL